MNLWNDYAALNLRVVNDLTETHVSGFYAMTRSELEAVESAAKQRNMRVGEYIIRACVEQAELEQRRQGEAA
jgi:hypothetical protein